MTAIVRFRLEDVLDLNEHALLSPIHQAEPGRPLDGPALILRLADTATLSSSGVDNPHQPVGPAPIRGQYESDDAAPREPAEYVLVLDAVMPMILDGVPDGDAVRLTEQMYIALSRKCLIVEIDATGTTPVASFHTMTSSTDTGDGATRQRQRVNPANIAYQRLMAILPEHLDMHLWQVDTGQPAMAVLTDLSGRGHSVRIAFLDSVEPDLPAVLLAIHADGVPSAHGKFTNQDAAGFHSAQLAADDPSIWASVALILNDPAVPPGAWLPIPAEAVDMLRPPEDDSEQAIVLLVHAETLQVAAVGPFATRADVEAYTPQIPGEAVRLVVPFHPFATS